MTQERAWLLDRVEAIFDAAERSADDEACQILLDAFKEWAEMQRGTVEARLSRALKERIIEPQGSL